MAAVKTVGELRTLIKDLPDDTAIVAVVGPTVQDALTDADVPIMDDTATLYGVVEKGIKKDTLHMQVDADIDYGDENEEAAEDEDVEEGMGDEG